MNETRKQIIELISDYMDKTLSEWCLLTWGKVINNNLDVLTDWDILWWPEIEDEEVVWHYDITAVLKYINEKNKYTEYWYDDIMIDNLYVYIVNISYWEEARPHKKWYIPNKPLHLYSEQEEKDLLDLLKKLW